MAADRICVLPLRRDHAGDAGRFDRSVAPHLPEPERRSPGLRVPGGLLSHSRQYCALALVDRSQSSRSLPDVQSLARAPIAVAANSLGAAYFLGGLRIGGG